MDRCEPAEILARIPQTRGKNVEETKRGNWKSRTADTRSSSLTTGCVVDRNEGRERTASGYRFIASIREDSFHNKRGACNVWKGGNEILPGAIAPVD